MPAKKSDTFFIRAVVNAGDNNTYTQTEIDIGAFVDALGKSILRIHSAEFAITDSVGGTLTIAANEGASCRYQLTTQTQTGLVLPSDRSVIASGHNIAFNDQGTPSVATMVTQAWDIGPQRWETGYLVAVDTLYLAGSGSTGFDEDSYVSVILECSTETMNKESAMALTLSQQ